MRTFASFAHVGACWSSTDQLRLSPHAAGCWGVPRGHQANYRQRRGRDTLIRSSEKYEQETAIDTSKSRDSTERTVVLDASAGVGPSDSDGEPRQPARLFSNLNDKTLRHEPGTVLGAAALVAGTTVGAGILALPSTTQVVNDI
jgi:hypothetical protein